MADNILETLIVELKANMQPLEAGLTQATRESQQAGVRIGQGLQAGIGRTNLSDDGVKLGQGLTAGITQGLKQGESQIDSQLSRMTDKARVSGGGFGGALSAGLGQGLAPALGSLGGLSAGLGNVTGAMGGAAAAAGPLAAGIAGITAALGASAVAANAAVNSYAEYEYKLSKISTLTDKTPGQLKGLGREIQELSRQTGKTVEDLGEAMYAALGASVRGAESTAGALNLVTVATKTASAGATDTATAMEALTNVLNAYRMEAGDAAEVSDKMVKAVAVGKMTFPELAQSLGMVTAIASQAGVSLDEVLGSLATMTANGIQMSSAVDYLRGAISAIVGPSAEAEKLAGKLGIQFNEAALKSKGFEGVLKDVMRATGGSTAQLKTLFGGVEAVTAVTSVASGNFERLTMNIKAVGNAAGETATQASKMTDNLKTEGEKFNRTWESVVRNFGELWAPTKTSLLKDVNELLTSFNKVLERWNVVRGAQRAEDNVEALEAELQAKREYLAGGRRIISGEVRAPDSLRKDWEERRLPTTLKAIADLEQKIAAAKQAQVQAEKDLATYRTSTSTAVLPKGVQGPNMGGSGGAATPVQVVTGRDLVTLLGMGGRTVLNEFGVSGANYHHDGAVSANATHNGIDYAAKRGSAILAPFTGELSVREDAKNGKIFELVDQAGNKIVGIHLDSFDKGVLAALNAGGGKAIIGQGTRIGGVGNTGTTAGSTPHLHLMGYTAGNSRPVDPTGIKFQGMGSAEYGVDGSKPTPTPSSGNSTNTDKDDKAAKNRAAIQKEIDASVAKGKVDAAQRALTELKRLQAEELDAAKGNATKRAQVIAQTGPQIIAAENRIARAVRDQAVQAAGQWAKEQLAKEGADKKAIEDERVRRVREAYATEAQAKKQAQSEQARAQSAADDTRDKEAQARAARINEAIRQGKIESARTELTRLQEMRTNDLRNAGENAQRVAQVEQRYATLTYNAKAAIALKEKQDRDADIQNDKSLNGTARAQALKNSEATYRNALLAASNERAGVQDRIDKEAADKARNAASATVKLNQDVTDAVLAELTRRAEEIDRINSEINDAEIAAANARYANVNGAMDAAMRGSYGVGADGLAAALKGYGVKSVEELAGINPTAADSIRRVYADVFKQMAEDLERAAQESLNIIEFYKEEAERLSGKRATQADAGQRMIEQRDMERVTTNTRAPSLMLSFLGGAGNEWFGDKFEQLGEEGRAAFLEKLNAVTPDDFAAVPLALLKSVRAKIGDAKEWQGLKATLDTAIGKSVENSANAGGWKELGGMIEQINALDATSATYSATLTGKFVPALEALRDRMTDPALKKAIDEVISGLGIQAANADTLAAAHAELAAAMNTSTEPYAAQIKGLEALKKAMPEAAAEIDALIKKWKELGAQQAAIAQGVKDVDERKKAEDLISKSERALNDALNIKSDPYEEQIAGLEGMKGASADLDAVIDNLIERWQTLQKIMAVTDVFKEYATYAQQLAGALGNLAEASGGSDLSANLKGAANLAGQLVALAGDVARIVANPADIGAWVGAITKVINGISEAMNGFRKAREQAAKMQKDFNEQFTFINGDNFSKTFTRSRGWLADTFGGGPEVKQEIDKIGLMFAKSLEGGFVGGIKGGLKEALEKNDFSLFSKTLKESVYDGILEGIVDAFINGELLKNIIGPAIKAWADAMKTPSTEDDVAALAGIDAAIAQVDNLAGKFFSDVAPKLNGIRDQWGIGQDGGASGGMDNRALFGNAPGVQLGVPQVTVSFPEGVMRGFTALETVVAPALTRASDRMYEAAELIIQAHRGGSGLQRLTNQVLR